MMVKQREPLGVLAVRDILDAYLAHYGQSMRDIRDAADPQAALTNLVGETVERLQGLVADDSERGKILERKV